METSIQADPVEEIRAKRMAVLLGVWDRLLLAGKVSKTHLRLSPLLANEVIEQYMADRDVLRKRYKISGRIQLHKIAGLMAAAILRFRPAVPMTDDLNLPVELYANELLAVYHGVAICAELTARDQYVGLIESPWFGRWLNEFIYLLHFRNYTAESLVFIFYTLTVLNFPENL